MIAVSLVDAMSMAGGDMGFWDGFYFACFVAGLLLSIVSLIGGMGHVSWHWHTPGMPHGPGGLNHGLGSGGLDGRGTSLRGPGPGLQGSGSVPWWNAFSIMVFLCWFGAAGYLMTRYGSLVAGVVFLLALVCGLAGGAVVFWFLTKVLLPHERELTPYETAVPGVVGKISAPIRAGGTGEILYQQMGATRSAPARADLGEPIAKGEEVFVVRYEQGIAYVRSGLSGEDLVGFEGRGGDGLGMTRVL